MLGCYDFCAHYEWTFAWLEKRAGTAVLYDYWERAIGEDSQRHAREAIIPGGIAGMCSYWGHTLAEESPDLGFHISHSEDAFRIDMHDCPSKGFLLRNELEQYSDYCDHCMGWTGPLMCDAGYVIDHEHNHRGQCWWVMRNVNSDPSSADIGVLAGKNDVRLRDDWNTTETPIDRYRRARSPKDKFQ